MSNYQDYNKGFVIELTVSESGERYFYYHEPHEEGSVFLEHPEKVTWIHEYQYSQSELKEGVWVEMPCSVHPDDAGDPKRKEARILAETRKAMQELKAWMEAWTPQRMMSGDTLLLPVISKSVECSPGEFTLTYYRDYVIRIHRAEQRNHDPIVLLEQLDEELFQI